MTAEFILFGVKFTPTRATPSIAKRISTLIETSTTNYLPGYDCFVCPFYRDTLIVHLYRSGIDPVGMATKWLVNERLSRELCSDLDDLSSYNHDFSLRLDDTSIEFYAAYLSDLIMDLDEVVVREPRSLSSLQEVGVPAKALVEVVRHREKWLVKAYYIDTATRRVVCASYPVPSNGKVEQYTITWETRFEQAPARLLMK